MSLLIALLLLGQQGDTAVRQTPDSTEVVYYGGKRVIYRADESRVYLLDSAWVRYQDLHLRSDSIIYDIRGNMLTSYKHSRFRTATDSVTGAELHYNVRLNKGYMTRAGTSVNQGFFTGHDLWLIREKVIDVNQGVYTTCDRNPPHYHFEGSRVRAYVDDVVIVEPLVMKIGKVPVAAAPFWFFPIAKNRKSGLLPFRIGQSSTEGFYAKGVSYYWAINDYSDATFVADVMTRKGFRWSGEGVYAVGPFAAGRLFGSYINESDTRHQRYSINAQHGGRFFLGTRIDARADFQSDASYVSEYSETPELWLRNEFDSYVSLSRTFKRLGSGNVRARRYVDVQQHRSILSLPEFGLSFLTIPVARGWNLNASLSGGNTRTAQGDSTGSDTLVTVRRSLAPSLNLSLPRSFLGLSLPLTGSYSDELTYRRDSLTGRNRAATAGTGLGFNQTLFGFLNLSEGLGVSQSVRFWPESTAAQASYTATVGSRFSLYRMFDIRAFGLNGMLHKVTPSAGYNFAPESRSAGFLGAPRFDTLPRRSDFGFGLANDFQVKVGRDSNPTKRTLARLDFASGYNFRLDSNRLSDISGRLDLFLLQMPQLTLDVSGNAVFGVRTYELGNYGVTSRFSYAPGSGDTTRRRRMGFSVDLQHYLSKQENMLLGQLKATPPGWSIALSGGWNIKTGEFVDYKLDLVKDLHCWEALANVTRLGTRWTYDFKVRIKAIPDISVGKGLFGWLLPSQ